MQTAQETQITCCLGWPRLDPRNLAPAFRTAWKRLAMLPVPECSGSGVIVCGGGRYERGALAVCRRIRSFDSDIRIEVWRLNEAEISRPQAFTDLGVVTFSATKFLHAFPMRRFAGWHLKIWSILRSGMQKVLYLDADCFPTREGLELLKSPEDAIFFGDVKRCHASDEPYSCAGLLPPRRLSPPRQEFETGQFIVDKVRWATALRWACWASEHSDVLWRPNYAHGDKSSIELGVRMSGQPYGWGESKWGGHGIDHFYGGKLAFQHCMAARRGEHPLPMELRDCFAHG